MRLSDDALTRSLCDAALKRYEPGTGRWHYEDGVLLKAFEAAYRRWGDPGYLDAVRRWGESAVSPDGNIVSYRRDEYNLDQVNPGKVLFFLLDETGDARYRAALDSLRSQLRSQPRTKAGGFWHKKIYPYQMWLDGLYMQGPFYAEYAGRYGPADDFDDVAAQFELMESRARDGATGLLRHAWDESRAQAWADPDTGRSPHFWSRAMGWYGMALVDALDFMPAGHPGRTSLIAILARYAEAARACQDPGSGMWYQVLDQGFRAGNYLETSGSAMFAYALAKAARMAYLPAEPYRLVAEAGRRGIAERMVGAGPDGLPSLGSICSVAGLGGVPYRDGSFAYYVGEPVVYDDYKGLGPFILASLELERTGHV
jgi:unsaturated rhamnogalacturonyl hydrolase